MAFTIQNGIRHIRNNNNAEIINPPIFQNTSYSDSTNSIKYIAVSNDGKYVLFCKNSTSGGGLYMSSNYGVTFGLIRSGNYYCCAISSTGQYMLAGLATGYLYSSADYGSSFYAKLSSSYSWGAVSISGNGQYQFAVTTVNGAYLSTTSGTTFTAISTSYIPATTNVMQETCTSISNDGKYIMFASWGLGVYFSSNYGSSFSKLIYTSFAGASSANQFDSCAMSLSGQYMAVSIYEFGIYLSSDYGASYTKISTPVGTDQIWWEVKISSNGKYVLASTTTNVYYTLNSGSTWTQVTTAKPGYYIAITPNGKYSYLFDNTTHYLKRSYV